MKSLEWMTEALCAQVGPDLFFSEGHGTNVLGGKKICGGCPVKAECRDHADHLEGEDREWARHGAWGAETPKERLERTKPVHATRGAARGAERDADIIRMCELGMTPPAIAQQLGVSDRTVARVKKEWKATA